MHYLSLVYFTKQPLQNICCPSSGGISSIPTRPTDSELKSTTRTSCCISPDDGLQICPKHVDVDWRNKLRINSASSWSSLRGYLIRTLVNISLKEYTRVLWWGCPNFPKIHELLQISKHQQDELKLVSHSGPKNVRHYQETYSWPGQPGTHGLWHYSGHPSPFRQQLQVTCPLWQTSSSSSSFFSSTSTSKIIILPIRVLESISWVPQKWTPSISRALQWTLQTEQG